VVKGHKTEGQELYYSVEREGQCQWHIRSSVILSLEQGNRLREQHSLGPYQPSTPLAKASDISLGNSPTRRLIQGFCIVLSQRVVKAFKRRGFPRSVKRTGAHGVVVPGISH